LRKKSAGRSEERSVRGPVQRSLHLSTEDGQLVAQDSDLKIGLGRCTLVRPKQAEDAAQEKIKKRADHGAALSQIGPLWDLDRVSLPHGVPEDQSQARVERVHQRKRAGGALEAAHPTVWDSVGVSSGLSVQGQ
jgi:hypothetical protein